MSFFSGLCFIPLETFLKIWSKWVFFDILCIFGWVHVLQSSTGNCFHTGTWLVYADVNQDVIRAGVVRSAELNWAVGETSSLKPPRQRLLYETSSFYLVLFSFATLHPSSACVWACPVRNGLVERKAAPVLPEQVDTFSFLTALSTYVWWPVLFKKKLDAVRAAVLHFRKQENSYTILRLCR